MEDENKNLLRVTSKPTATGLGNQSALETITSSYADNYEAVIEFLDDKSLVFRIMLGTVRLALTTITAFALYWVSSKDIFEELDGVSERDQAVISVFGWMAVAGLGFRFAMDLIMYLVDASVVVGRWCDKGKPGQFTRNPPSGWLSTIRKGMFYFLCFGWILRLAGKPVDAESQKALVRGVAFFALLATDVTALGILSGTPSSRIDNRACQSSVFLIVALFVCLQMWSTRSSAKTRVARANFWPCFSSCF